ncbi:MAG: hypothetical protein WAZ20_00330 [Methanothrix sp.]|jgi:hypothetical protein|nr:hypothetical protein [Methanothrix sp.]MDI9416818.1 hypothetical protein [Euryarchaeota archaeon]HON35813.1 hypothetical protein [Methanothrix sp.]HPW73211.1 hypothetical protein [Methanothrix sp.]
MEIRRSDAYKGISHLFEEGAKRVIRKGAAKKSRVNPCEALASP